jgi:hypothetical protein
MAILFHNGALAKMAKGRYQTRNNRVVEITGSHVQTAVGTDGKPYSKTMWDGLLYQADGKTIETPHMWSDAGGYLHEEGVSNQFDIALVTSQEPEPVSDPAAPAVLENQLLCAALVDRLAQVDPKGAPLDVLNRLISKLQRGA